MQSKIRSQNDSQFCSSQKFNEFVRYAIITLSKHAGQLVERHIASQSNRHARPVRHCASSTRAIGEFIIAKKNVVKLSFSQKKTHIRTGFTVTEEGI